MHRTQKGIFGGRRLGLAALLAGALAAASPQPAAALEVEPLRPALVGLRATAVGAGDFLIGSFALERGDVRSASEAFRRALAADPRNLDLRQRVFFLTLASGEVAQAVREAERLLELDEEAPEARLLLALDALRQNRLDEAAAELERVPRAGIAGVALPLLEAWLAAADGDPDRALERIEEVRQAEATRTLRAYHRGMLMAQLGRHEEALEALAEAAPEGEPAPIRIVEAHAHVLALAGHLDAAQELIEAHRDRQPDDMVLLAVQEALAAGLVPRAPIASPEAGVADALLGLAEALQQQVSGQAILYARLALVVEPELAEAALLLGSIFAQQENHELALELLAAVPASRPQSWEARLRAAGSLHAQGRIEEAVRSLEAMASERPERIDPLVTIGDLLRRDEEFERAEVAYTRAIERIDGFERQHWPLLYTRGITYERTGRWDEAEADFLLALELEPEQPYVLNYLAYSWVDQGVNLERALPMLERAVELRPNNGFIIDSLGWAHYRLGDYDKAVPHLERAVELEPGDPILNDHLGDAYWRVGRKREARFQWQRALTLDPDEDEIALIEDKLEHGLPDRAAANIAD